MTISQRFFKAVFPASSGAAMKKESRELVMRCREYGFARSIRESGGIRWKASGNPLRKLRCQNCGQFVTRDKFRQAGV